MGQICRNKVYFRSKAEKENIATEFCIFEFVNVPNFNLKWQFWFFGTNLPKMGISRVKQKKWITYWILRIQISLGTKFQLKLTTLVFWTKFSKKMCFWSKTKKKDINIKFYVPNFSLNWQFWFFGPDLSKWVFPVKNGKSEYHYCILHTRISRGTKFQFKLTIFIFLTKFDQSNSGLKEKSHGLKEKSCVHGRYLLY